MIPGSTLRTALPPLLAIGLMGCAGEDDDAIDAAEQRSPPVASAPSSEAFEAETPAAGRPTLTMYKTPTCGCCTLWQEHMEAAGFEVEVIDTEQMAQVKRELGIPPPLQACHTAVIGDYLVEGHVPASDVQRLLEEQPDWRGVAVPGMPLGSPGMEHPQAQPYESVVFDEQGNTEVYTRHDPTPRWDDQPPTGASPESG